MCWTREEPRGISIIPRIEEHMSLAQEGCFLAYHNLLRSMFWGRLTFPGASNKVLCAECGNTTTNPSSCSEEAKPQKPPGKRRKNCESAPRAPVCVRACVAGAAAVPGLSIYSTPTSHSQLLPHPPTSKAGYDRRC